MIPAAAKLRTSLVRWSLVVVGLLVVATPPVSAADLPGARPTYGYDRAITAATASANKHVAAFQSRAAATTPAARPRAAVSPRRSAPRTAQGSVRLVSDRFLAAKGGRFVVDSAGETRVFVHAGEDAFEVSQHAALRITQRNLTVDQVEGVVNSAQPFRYFHGGAWKTGYYDPASRVFVGRGGNTITTVINNAKPQYIENPKAAQP